tara:strand:- start:3032 stop:3682 length:651 start_codon:yes stop_codon:yes gene_type:complete
MDFFHVLNRGVDKRTVFEDDGDYFRFTQNLFIYNNTEQAPHNEYSTQARMKLKPEKRLVVVHAYCLMPNHYHLLLSPLVENGIALFMQKVNMGYTKYFNEKNDRSGTLWQGKYKAIEVTDDAHFQYLPYYIHLNALDLTFPQWRNGLVSQKQKAHKLLAQYRWSSHRLLLNPETAADSLIQNSVLLDSFKLSSYLKDIEEIISNELLAIPSNDMEI